jgi:hypothetical protein
MYRRSAAVGSLNFYFIGLPVKCQPLNRKTARFSPILLRKTFSPDFDIFAKLSIEAFFSAPYDKVTNKRRSDFNADPQQSEKNRN